MYKVDVNICDTLGEETYKVILENGLSVYICKKVGFEKKIGLFGTKYGSIHRDFIDIMTNKRIQVPDGIAHFLEHKLFEKEGANALDLFSKMGVSSNAYTSFDQTVFYFETMTKLEESIKMLVKLIKEPYFTDENVQKEQGIIGQEIMMYDDDPSFKVYFNTLRAMYINNPVRIDIAGTVESIAKINKELLYTCYNTFYSPQNMFFVVVGDVDIENTIKLIEDNVKLYEKDYGNNVKDAVIEKFFEEEENKVNEKEIEEKMDIFMPLMCIGYKLNIVHKEEILKREIICDFISDMYFSKITDFYEKEYNEGKISEPISFDYEGAANFSHVIISAASTKVQELKNDLLSYIDRIKNEDIDNELFEITKRKKIGNMVLTSDNLNVSYRRIIDSIINDNDIYAEMEILKNITKDDVKKFLLLLNDDNQVISIVKEKNK